VTIFNWVRNHIDYEHYHGVRRGAGLTLLEGRGNDMDHCLLLAALLTAAGHTDFEFRTRGQRIDYADLRNWIGLAEDPYPGKTFEEAFGLTIEEAFPNGTDRGVGDAVAKRAVHASNFLASRGSVLSSNNSSAVPWFPSFPGKATVVFDRSWLQLNYQGTTYSLDPSHKTYERIDGEELLAATGYDRADLLAALGGNSTANYAKNLDAGALGTYVEGVHADLLARIRTEFPDLSMAEIASGRRIVEADITDPGQAFPLPALFFGTDRTLASLGAPYRTTVRFRAGAIDYTIPTAELKGRKITLTFSGNTVELRLDDGPPVATTSTSAAEIDLEITVTHPGGLIDPQSETKTYRKNDAFMYAILYGFAPSGRLLQERHDVLNGYLDEGKADGSREVRTEILNIMGLTWLYQTRLTIALLAHQNDIGYLHHHRFGRMAQEEGFYVDVGLQLSGSLPRDGVRDESFDNVFHLGSLFASALEHGIIEQMQPGTSAVSTVNIIREANAGGQRIYLADAANWNNGVKGKINDNYASAQVAEFTGLIENDGARLLLPYNDNVSQGIWTGTGYIVRGPTRAGMIISGGYSGGFSTNFGNVSSPPVTNSFFSSPFSNYDPVTAYTPTLTPPSNTAPSLFSFDPVDMATGAFHLASTDLRTGLAPAPRGLAFRRTYRGNTAANDRQNLGHGWTHNLHIRATERTAAEEGLGSGTPEQAAALLTSTLVAADLYRTQAAPREWVAAALTVGWFTDELLDNAVSVTMGEEILQFIQQPDGSYTAPAGQTLTLRRVGGKYRLEERLGNTIRFDPEGRADFIEDPDGKRMHFHYHGDGRLDYVEDAYARRLTLAYDADDRITAVTCSTGRSIDFRHDAHGNLDRYTGPEGKHRHYIYEAAADPHGAAPADPSATPASEHRIVRLRNHDLEIVVQNIHDSLGRVGAQYLHGDPAKTWTLRYTGPRNSEENPRGGVKYFEYDERGRATAVEDETGHRATWRYDGQDRIVERTSPAGEVTAHAYDAHHNRIRTDHPRGGGSTRYEYDALHRLVEVTDPAGHATGFVYAASGFHAGKDRPLQVTDPAGTTTHTYYEAGPAAGRRHTTTDADGLTTEHAYDAFAQPLWTETHGGFRTTFTHSARGDLTETIAPGGTVTRHSYNARRQRTATTRDHGGPGAATTEREYDNQGRLALTRAPAHNDGLRVETRTTYSPTDKVLARALANDTPATHDDLVAAHEYDGRDWRVATEDAAGRRTERDCFPDGELRQITRPGPGARTTTFTRDADDRPLTRTDPGTPAPRDRAFAYGVTDPAEGDITDGRPRTVTTHPGGQRTVREHDPLGRLRYYANKKGYLYEFRYDGLGRRTEVITPLGRTTATAHNHRGAPTQITEPSGQTTTFAYDPATGRPASQTDDAGTIEYTAYDPDGNLLELRENGATLTRGYDNLNRVTSYTDSQGNTLGYRYYPSGALHKLIYPGGSATGPGHVEYTYHQTGRLHRVIDKLGSAASPRITTYTWNHDGTLARVNRPNGTYRAITYDAAGRPQSIEERTSAGALIASYDLSYFDSDDAARQREDGAPTGVPGVQRRVRKAGALWATDEQIKALTTLPEITADPIESPASLNLTYDADNRLATYQRPYVDAQQTVVHDADPPSQRYGGTGGNMTQGPAVDGDPATYSYDARNRLTNAGGLSYAYNAEDVRTQVTGNGTTTTYVTDPHGDLSRVLARTKNGQTTRYIYGVGLLYEIDSSGNATYYHFDQVGNTAALTDESQAVTDRFRYSPYGVETYREGDHDTPFRFGGFFGIQTDANGLIHMRARYYHPLIRRFVNADPAQAGWNWYVYANGNPVMFVDPSGEISIVATAFIGGAIGAFAGGITAAIQGENVLVGIGSGALGGAITGSGVGLVSSLSLTGGSAIATLFGSGVLGSAVDNSANQFANTRRINLRELSTASTAGGAFSIIPFGNRAAAPLSRFFNRSIDRLLTAQSRHIDGLISAGVNPRTIDRVTNHFLDAGTRFETIGNLTTEFTSQSVNTSISRPASGLIGTGLGSFGSTHSNSGSSGSK